FETVDAREAFPCFDEPGFKVPWRLELTVPKGLVVAANNPIESTQAAEAGWKKVTFAETPPLPSYLLAVAGQAKNAAMARDSTAPLLAALERWFGQRYPFAKLDLVAVPEYGSGAM